MAQLATDHRSMLSGFRSLTTSGTAEPPFLEALRREAAARFEYLGLPDRKIEAWRFTGVGHLADTEFVQPDPTAAPSDFDPLPDVFRMVFVDGLMRPELSDLHGLPAGVSLESLGLALERDPDSLEGPIGRDTALFDHPFATLNTAQFRDGALLRIADGVVVERPIHLLFLASVGDGPVLAFPRLLIAAGRGSQATVVESHQGATAPSLSCPVSEISLGEGAVLDHTRIVDEGAEVSHIAATQIRQARNSAYRGHGFTIGGGLVRHDITANLEGEGADATLNGLYLTGGRQHVDHQLRVHHKVPHCTSHQLYKGVLTDRSRAVFNGRIVVDPGAQKTDAKQSNRNLLLSETALVHSNPQLEIFADDVRCTHGSTVGRLDEDAVFYLRTRGIDRTAARSLLTFAFASEVVDRVRVPPVRDALRNVLVSRLPGADLLREVL